MERTCENLLALVSTVICFGAIVAVAVYAVVLIGSWLWWML
jgi:hypothetical protein